MPKLYSYTGCRIQMLNYCVSADSDAHQKYGTFENNKIRFLYLLKNMGKGTRVFK